MSKNNNTRFNGLGIGYVSLVMLFTVICLTVLSVLSYQAASANDMLNEKNSAFTTEFYDADSRAKEKLSAIDSASLGAMQSQLQGGFFDDEFTACCDEIGGITLQKLPDGFKVSFSEPVNDRLSLDVQAKFYSRAVDGRRYSIERWKTTASDDIGSADPPDVWDGGALFGM